MMHRLTSFLFVILLVGVSSPLAHAQGTTEASVSGQGSLSFGLGVPTGAFNDNVEQLGYGANLYIGAQFGDAPFSLGLDVSFFTFGRSVRNVPFSETVGGAVRVDVITTNSVVQPHLTLRVQPGEGMVRPYLEGLFGFKYLFTDTRVEDEDRRDESIASSRNFDDFTLSGGGGAGVHIRLVRDFSNGANEANNVGPLYLKVGAQYLLGRQAEYLDISDGYDPDNPDVQRSTTNMFVPMVGLALQF
jgi:hypothetical protein